MLSSSTLVLLALLVAQFAYAAAFQQDVALPNGANAQVNWQVQGQETVIFTIKLNTIDFGWLGFGVASSNGLGTDLVTGGPQGGGSIVAMKVQDQPTVREFALLPQSRFEPYNTEGIVLQDALDCMSTFCQSESQSCFSQALCRNSLTCASSKFDLLPANLTENSGPELMDLVQECINPLSNPEMPEQNKALSLLLNAGSCFASSCSAKMLEISTRRSNVNSTLFTQPGDGTSTLQVVLEQRQIARARFAEGSVHSFFVLLGEPFTGNVNSKTKLTPVHSQAVFTINVDTGVEERIAVPMWLMVHVALAVVGFAGVFALSLCMRRIKMRRHTWIPFTLAGVGITLGSVGAVVVSIIGQKSDPQDLHKVLSLTVIMLCVGVWIGAIYHQPNQTASSSWRTVLARGRNNGGETGSSCVGVLPVMELVCLGGLAAACITGYTTVQSSSIESKDLILGVIVGCGICALSALLILAWPLVAAMMRTTTTKKQAKEVMQVSSNPVFADLGPTATALGVNSVLPLTLSWNNLSFTAPARKGGNGMPKPILHNAVEICPPRTLTCVLGPSGAGKSSLMDFLSSRNTHAPSSGTQLLVNGTPMESFPQLHRHMALVPQSDVLHEHLTVLETLQFACEMILPQSMQEQDKVDHMLRIVAQLGMGHVLDTLVGGQSIRGLSGGERRRVSIALQLVKSPSILFCDEPTSGLDAHMALKLCKVLRELANEGRTVFATIHQPSVSCFELFDRLVVMSAGNTVYSGPRMGAMQFLQECNRGLPTTSWNPADWILTLVDFKREENDANIVLQNGQVVEYRIDEKTDEILKRKKILSQNKAYKTAATHAFDESSLAGSNAPMLRQAVFAYYAAVNPEKTKEDPGLVDEICTYTATRGVDAVENKLKSRYGVSFLPFLLESTQQQQQPKNIEPCTKEELESIVAKFKASKFHADLLSRITAATSKQDVLAQELTGQATIALREQKDYSQPFMVQMRLLAERSFLLVWRNPQALRFQAAQNIVFGLLLGALYSNLKTLNSPFQVAFSMASILAMVAFVALSLGTQVAFNDKLVLEREISEAMYSPYAHFTQRIMVGIPVGVFVALCLIVPAYFLIGLRMDGDAFFFFFLVNMAIVFVFDSIVFALTLIASNVNTAYAMGNFIEAMTIFFSGVFIPVYAMPSFLGWIYYLSPFSYAFGAVVQNEFLGTDNEFVISLTGVVVPHPWLNLIIVFFMGVAWRLFGLFGIIRLFNRKRPGRKPKLV